MTDPMPAEVKEQVKKELNKRDFSWIRRDWVVVSVLFTVLAVLSGISSYNTAKVRKTVENSGITAECFTPNTPCSDFLVASQKAERDYLARLMSNTGNCVLLTSGAVNNETIPFEPGPVSVYYEQCLRDRVRPAPGEKEVIPND